MRPLLPLLLLMASASGPCIAEERSGAASPSATGRSWQSLPGTAGTATTARPAFPSEQQPLQELIRADAPSLIRPLQEWIEATIPSGGTAKLSENYRVARVRLHNPNPYPVLFYGRGGADAPPRVSEAWTRLDENGRWVKGRFDGCGSGLRFHEIPASGSVEVDVFLPGDPPQQALLTFSKKDDPIFRSQCVIFEQR